LGGGGLETFTVNLPDTPSLVAVITAEPAATAVTSPEEDTVAALVLPELQVTTRPVSTLLFASRVVAVSCEVWPMLSDALPVTFTDATGAGAGAFTVSVAEPVTPSLVARIATLPAATAVTSPVLDTVARAVFALLHVTVRPVSTLLFASRSVAVACVVCPAVTVDALNATLTDATGGGAGAVTVSVALPL